ncbi:MULTISPECIES: ABC transporter ATP-binding protein [Pseudothermotoga]|uniref:ABC transporter ATP-binding protein n=1 Tax=Pseudothermotoga TaxID=1643951 RepID=UPI0007486757|nr:MULTISPECIES: ABC transporter ATP-binding protein [Pseudothermotoga]KUK21275.1 MAG: ABC transporter related [Pseudothermotoga lettingae]MDK2885208.1 ATP-binding cassette, subfamily multidrug efflux pump [Pseudothermotoga sp.]HBJ80381.1 multidrug ABC transporter ATP-binding protein [Pseudothermotoga sp.]HBT26447.1 multidrug ABC transporter ATP-binding protein [Pseudothermotoga sp.]
MKVFLRYLKPYWLSTVLAPLFMVIEVICDLAQPTLLARIVDEGIARGNLQLVWKTGIFMLLVALIGAAGGIGCTIFASHASQNFGADLRRNLFKKVLNFSITNVNKFHTSSLITRLTNDVTQLQNLVMMLLRIVVRAPLLFIGGILMAISINAHLSSIFIFLIPPIIFLFLWLTKKGDLLFRKIQDSVDRVNAVVRENLLGVRVVRAFRREEYEKENFHKNNELLKNSMIKAFSLIVFALPVFIFIVNAGTIGVLWFGGVLVKKNQMEVGNIIAYTNYLMQIMFSLMMIGNILNFVVRAGASAKRVLEVLDEQPAIHELQNALYVPEIKGRVDFEDVEFRYSGDTSPVLKNVNFSVKSGEVIAILGETGSGKTTLMNLIPRLIDVTSGDVKIDDFDVRVLKLQNLRKYIAAVPQETNLFSGTVKENLKWGKEDATDEEVIKAAKIAQIHDFIINLPQGYDSYVERGGRNFSGGQKQRLSIARALVRKPKILILDDCTSSVDPITERKILEGLREYTKGCTTFIITQKISTALLADRILTLQEGKMVGFGTHEDLLRNCEAYREIYESQLGNGMINDA